MFSDEDLVFSYTTKQAVSDGELFKADAEILKEASIKIPLYFSRIVWDRYIEVPDELSGLQDKEARLWDILSMFSQIARNCSYSQLQFTFSSIIPDWKEIQPNETRNKAGFQLRDVTLKAIVSAQDIDDPSPAIFIMLPWED